MQLSYYDGQRLFVLEMVYQDLEVCFSVPSLPAVTPKQTARPFLIEHVTEICHYVTLNKSLGPCRRAAFFGGWRKIFIPIESGRNSEE
jgi:hypothetical protein